VLETHALLQKNAQLEAEVGRLFAQNETLFAQNQTLSAQLEKLTAQVNWFQNQLFGQKSEKRFAPENPAQLHLGEQFQTEAAAAQTQTIKEHQRKKKSIESVDGDCQKLFFDETRVPVETVEIDNPAIAGLGDDEYEVVGERVSYRLAQKPSAFVILKYVRKVIKLKRASERQKAISCAPMPPQVFDKSHADVSFLAGLLVDKFQYHLPLYRQHQRLESAGINVSRQWLTQLVHRCGDLLTPIFNALVESIRTSRVKLMDETPIKAGREKKGRMRTAYFWPVMAGDEVAFLYFDSREHHHVFKALGAKPGDDAVIVSDGYGAYKAYAKKTGTDNAQCWTHARREFIEAEAIEPKKVEEALELLRPLWRIEKEIAAQQLDENEKLIYRVLHAKPVVDAFFAWVAAQQKETALLPGNRFTEALNYVSKRKEALSIFLIDPDVPIDTNEIERALRVIPMGRKNWLFCWTEVGAAYVGIFQSLIVTCRMNGVDPFTYLVDVLQRVSDHPKTDVQQLTPAGWKQHFADAPRRSLIHFLR
jgi:transposase